jgi:hypothetical protein
MLVCLCACICFVGVVYADSVPRTTTLTIVQESFGRDGN